MPKSSGVCPLDDATETERQKYLALIYFFMLETRRSIKNQERKRTKIWNKGYDGRNRCYHYVTKKVEDWYPNLSFPLDLLIAS